MGINNSPVKPYKTLALALRHAGELSDDYEVRLVSGGYVLVAGPSFAVYGDGTRCTHSEYIRWVRSGAL